MVALLRGLYARPRLLLCDEGFKSLDHYAEEAAIRAVLDVSGSSPLTALIVVHDPRIAARIADEVVILRHGRVKRTFAIPEGVRRLSAPLDHREFIDVEKAIARELAEAGP